MTVIHNKLLPVSSFGYRDISKCNYYSQLVKDITYCEYKRETVVFTVPLCGYLKLYPLDKMAAFYRRCFQMYRFVFWLKFHWRLFQNGMAVVKRCWLLNVIGKIIEHSEATAPEIFLSQGLLIHISYDNILPQAALQLTFNTVHFTSEWSKWLKLC